MYMTVNAQAKKKFGVNVIAEELGVPKQFLSKILQTLVKKKLLNSSKGKMGGFYLSSKNMNGNLRNIIEVFDGDDVFCSCVMGLPECSSENPCPLHEATALYRLQLKSNLESKNIRDLGIQILEEDLRI